MDLREHTEKDLAHEIHILRKQLHSRVEAFMERSAHPLTDVEELRWKLVQYMRPHELTNEEMYTVLFPK
jgi:hypothetical protein